MLFAVLAVDSVLFAALSVAPSALAFGLLGFFFPYGERLLRNYGVIEGGFGDELLFDPSALSSKVFNEFLVEPVACVADAYVVDWSCGSTQAWELLVVVASLTMSSALSAGLPSLLLWSLLAFSVSSRVMNATIGVRRFLDITRQATQTTDRMVLVGCVLFCSAATAKVYSDGSVYDGQLLFAEWEKVDNPFEASMMIERACQVYYQRDACLRLSEVYSVGGVMFPNHREAQKLLKMDARLNEEVLDGSAFLCDPRELDEDSWNRCWDGWRKLNDPTFAVVANLCVSGFFTSCREIFALEHHLEHSADCLLLPWVALASEGSQRKAARFHGSLVATPDDSPEDARAVRRSWTRCFADSVSRKHRRCEVSQRGPYPLSLAMCDRLDIYGE